MHKDRTGIVECFTPLMVYTLEFADNYAQEIYSVEKLIADYDKLIESARVAFNSKNVKSDFNDALFPFVAWIDEVIQSSDFKDKKQWRKYLLQKRYFSTSNAGWEFYERLSSLEENIFDIRLVYLYCLFLGFRGRYYKDEDEIDSIFQNEKSLVSDSFSKEFPAFTFKDAYAQEQPTKKKTFTSSYRGLWILMGVSTGLGLVFFSLLQAHLNDMLIKYNIF
ncbi:MAG: DotU family type IV/VI secretion system protein [Sulfurimonas sp.]|nr:DotU family type IV/VI secretion system protein [Sulfurimonas sp.]